MKIQTHKPLTNDRKAIHVIGEFFTLQMILPSVYFKEKAGDTEGNSMVSQFSLSSAVFISLLVTLIFKSLFLGVCFASREDGGLGFLLSPRWTQRVDVAYLALEATRLFSHSGWPAPKTLLLVKEDLPSTWQPLLNGRQARR